jgi:hypothetical protein
MPKSRLARTGIGGELPDLAAIPTLVKSRGSLGEVVSAK